MKSYVSRIAVALSLIAAIVTATPRVASASYSGVHFVNPTKSCVWVTIYWSSHWYDNWVIVNGAGKPRFVKPGERADFYWSNFVESVKMRGEVKQFADCSGSNISDTYDQRHDDNVSKSYVLDGHLFAHANNKFNMWFK